MTFLMDDDECLSSAAAVLDLDTVGGAGEVDDDDDAIDDVANDALAVSEIEVRPLFRLMLLRLLFKVTLELLDCMI